LYSHCLTVFQFIVLPSLLIYKLPLLSPCLFFVQLRCLCLCVIVILLHPNITIDYPCPSMILFHEEKRTVSLCHVVYLLSVICDYILAQDFQFVKGYFTKRQIILSSGCNL